MKNTPLSILAFSGSLRKDSSNTLLTTLIGKMIPGHIQFSVYPGLSELPHFDGSEHAPQSVKNLRDKIAAADGILICSPEYAFGVPGSLKNALDWTVSSGSIDNKPLALITASTGGEKAHAAMLHILTALNATLTTDTTLLIPFIRSKLNSQGEITDDKTLEQIRRLVTAFIALIEMKHPHLDNRS